MTPQSPSWVRYNLSRRLAAERRRRWRRCWLTEQKTEHPATGAARVHDATARR